MRVPEHCTADAGMFFDGHPAELALYEALFRRMDGAFPEGTVKVQKSQISFYGRHLFAAASLQSTHSRQLLHNNWRLSHSDKPPNQTTVLYDNQNIRPAASSFCFHNRQPVLPVSGIRSQS